MTNKLASSVSTEEESAQVRTIIAAATAVLGMPGISERGPLTEVQCTSFDEWERVFGNPTVNNQDTYLAVKAYFENGGSNLHFVRTVHYSDATDPTTKTSAAATMNLSTAAAAATKGTVVGANAAPFAIVSGHTLVVAIDGPTNATATFTAVAAVRESGAGTFNIPNNATLLLSLNGGSGQTITFITSNFVDNTAATAAEVAAVINAQLVGGKATVTNTTHVSITSDKKGTGSGVNVTGGSANGGILAYTTGNIAGSGNVADGANVSIAEVKTIVELALAGITVSNDGSNHVKIERNTTGTGSTVQVTGGSTAGAELGFDNAVHAGGAGGTQATLGVDAKTDGTYGNGVSVIVAAPTNGASGYFNLQVVVLGKTVETFTNLNLLSTSAAYALTRVNDANIGSNYIALRDLASTLPSPSNLPAPGTFGPLTGGLDGLGSLADIDFLGGSGVNGATGFRALDTVQDLSLIACPQRATATVHNGMITYCEINRAGEVFAVLDPPANQSAAQIISYVKVTAAIQQLSEYAAIYWPRVLVDNPNTAVFGNTATLVAPPSGALCGMYSRTDASRDSGVFQHPAGTDNGRLFNVRGFETNEVKKKAVRDLVFPELINPISIERNTPIFVDGARTLKDTGNWPTIGERRGVIFIEVSLKTSLVFMRHRNINPRLYGEGKNATTAFMLLQTKNEAFSTKDPQKAFRVDFGAGLNPASVAQARTVVGRVSVATAKPAEYVVLKISPDQRALLEELAAATGT